MTSTLSSSSFTITWDNLFPNDSSRKELRKNFSEKYPQKVNKKIHTGTLIVEKLIPDIYRSLELTRLAKSTFSKYWTFNKLETGSKKHYDATFKAILKYADTGNYRFETFEFNKILKQNVTELLSWLSDTSREQYQKKIETDVINKLEEISSLKKLNINLIFSDDNLPDFVSKLSCLVAIAATWPYWTNCNENTERLASILLPYHPANIQKNQADWKKKHINRQKELAARALREALSAFDNKDYNLCGDKCHEITQRPYADDYVFAQAYKQLHICCTEYNYNYQGKLNPNELLKKAKEYGYIDMTDSNQPLENSSDSIFSQPLLDAPGTPASKNSYIIFNTSSSNECVKTLLATIPSDIPTEDIIFTSTSLKLTELVSSPKNLKYFLFDDNYFKNFQNLIDILEEIELLNKPPHTQRSWNNITIYIRANEERYSPLIDTALKRINGICLRIHIIDDGKWPAQRLLNCHPTFYPIRSYTNTDLHEFKQKSFVINYIVISAKSDDLTNWLIREAFWLGCFYYTNITFSITFISPEAEKIDSRLRFDCPDMFDEDFPDSKNSSKVCIKPAVTVDSLTSANLITKLRDLEDMPNSFSYYVINSENDIENLNLGIKIREFSIKHSIKKNDSPDKISLPIISFHCKDSRIGVFSKQLIVHLLEHGDTWYNNYNLIPFGMLNDRYTWNEIDGGYLEKVAKCAHLQYSGLDISASPEEISAKLTDYYNRTYNRDSSMAVALSMPYRLFQTTVDSKTSHILPVGRWEISEKNAHSRPESIEEMAKLFEEAMENEKANNKYNLNNNENLLYYEHSRWLRWAISRGWERAEPEQVITYMKAKNPKHQLYIARMHGCICSVDDLKTLAETMSKEATNEDWKRFAETPKKEPKDFSKYDKSNIQMTADIIRTKWIKS